MAKCQVMFWGVELGVSCQAFGRPDVVFYIELLSRQRAIPQILLVAATVEVRCNVCRRPISELVDIGEDIVSCGIECIDVIEDRQKTQERREFGFEFWTVDAGHEDKQTVEAVVVNLRSVRTFVSKRLQERGFIQDCASRAQFEPVAPTFSGFKPFLEVYVRTAFLEARF